MVFSAKGATNLNLQCATNWYKLLWFHKLLWYWTTLLRKYASKKSIANQLQFKFIECNTEIQWCLMFMSWLFRNFSGSICRNATPIQNTININCFGLMTFATITNHRNICASYGMYGKQTYEIINSCFECIQWDWDGKWLWICHHINELLCIKSNPLFDYPLIIHTFHPEITVQRYT